jgi:hypothetical protein
MYFVFCHLYPFSLQPPRQWLAPPRCHLSTRYLGCGQVRACLFNPYDWRGFVGAKKKTSVVLSDLIYGWAVPTEPDAGVPMLDWRSWLTIKMPIPYKLFSSITVFSHFLSFFNPCTRNQCCGSVTFWYGSGSADPYFLLTDPDSDPDPTPAPDPGIFVCDLQGAYYFFFEATIT